MMYLNNSVLVVEGTNDVSYLSSFIKGEIVSLNGLEVKKDTIKYLKELERNKKIIILCDPDEAGERISNCLKEKLQNYVVIKIDKKYCTRGVKNGVAECEKSEIIAKLKPFLSDNCTENKQIINLSDIEKLKAKYSITNEDICDYYNLGNVNTKTMIRRLIALGLSVEILESQFEKNYENK